MNWIKKYLEKRKQEQEKRKQEKLLNLEKKKQEEEYRKQQEFLNTRIPLNELVGCEMHICYDIEYFGDTFWTAGCNVKFNPDSYKILRKIKEKDGYSYIDPTTGRKYKKASHYSVEIGDLVIKRDTIPLKFSEEALKRQYITVGELIKFKMKNKQN